MKQCVRFKSDFKTESNKGELPGRDLAEFLSDRLNKRHFEAGPIEDEEIWFTVKVVSSSKEFLLMVNQSSLDEEYWEISCQSKTGTLAKLFGKSEEAELQNLTDAIDEILRSEKTVRDIKWYKDYEELCDDYAKKRGEKRLSTVGKYLEKLFLPLFLGGMALAIIGVILNGKNSFLFRAGAIMFLLPVGAYFGFIVICGLWGLFDNIKQTFQKKEKKKWGRWILGLFFVLLFLLPFVGFFMGLTRNPAIEKQPIPTLGTYAFRFMLLLFFSVMAVIFGTLLVRSFSKIFISRYREKNVLKNFFCLIGLFFILTGFSGFLSGPFASLGMLKWIPQSFEFPLSTVEGIDIDKDGNLFVACAFYSRIQMYNPKGDFVRGWFLDDTGGGAMKIKVNNENDIEVAIFKGRKIDIFDETGELLKSSQYDRSDLSFWDSFEQKGKNIFDDKTRQKYSVESFAFTRITQKSPNGVKNIGRNAFYLFPAQGPFQGWLTAITGMILAGWAEKKKLKRTAC
jgi:hypothetical protein